MNQAFTGSWQRCPKCTYIKMQIFIITLIWISIKDFAEKITSLYLEISAQFLKAEIFFFDNLTSCHGRSNKSDWSCYYKHYSVFLKQFPTSQTTSVFSFRLETIIWKAILLMHPLSNQKCQNFPPLVWCLFDLTRVADSILSIHYTWSFDFHLRPD